MPQTSIGNKKLEAFSARLILAAALDELREDPEAFGRFLIAIAKVKGTDAVALAEALVLTEAAATAEVPAR